MQNHMLPRTLLLNNYKTAPSHHPLCECVRGEPVLCGVLLYLLVERCAKHNEAFGLLKIEDEGDRARAG